MDGKDFRKINIVIEALRRHRDFQLMMEGTLPFIIYRADTGAVLARDIYGFESAKDAANQLRKRLNLKWDQVKFKADRTGAQRKSYQATSGKRMDYAPRYNPSKRTRFEGYYDSQGNYYDID